MPYYFLWFSYLCLSVYKHKIIWQEDIFSRLENISYIFISEIYICQHRETQTHKPKRTKFLWINYWYQFSTPNSWKPSHNPRWISIPVGLSHLFMQEMKIRGPGNVKNLLTIASVSEHIGDICFPLWIHRRLTLRENVFVWALLSIVCHYEFFLWSSFPVLNSWKPQMHTIRTQVLTENIELPYILMSYPSLQMNGQYLSRYFQL